MATDTSDQENSSGNGSMVERTADGRFVKGGPGGPGRPKGSVSKGAKLVRQAFQAELLGVHHIDEETGQEVTNLEYMVEECVRQGMGGDLDAMKMALVFAGGPPRQAPIEDDRDVNEALLKLIDHIKGSPTSGYSPAEGDGVVQSQSSPLGDIGDQPGGGNGGQE